MKWLRGWPLRFLVLASDQHRRQEVAVLRDDWLNFEMLKEKAGKKFRDIEKRSVFQTMAVQQVVGILRACNWDYDNEAFVDWVQCRAKSVYSSFIAEECFQRQRGAETSGVNKTVSSIRKYHVLIEKGIINKVNQMADVVMAPQERLPSVSARVFRAPFNAVPAWIKTVCTTSSSPTWYSPSPENSVKNVADLALLEHVRMNRCWDKIGDAWWSILLRGRACTFLVRRIGSRDWYFPLGDVCEVAGCGWPASLSVVGARSWATPDCNQLLEDMRVHWLHILDPTVWEAVGVTWHSPLGQAAFAASHRGEGGQAEKMPVTIACVLGEQIETLLKFAARHAFFALPLTAIKKIGQHILATFDDGESSLYEVLETVVSKALPGLTPQELVDIMSTRLGQEEVDTAPLAEFDDVWAVMDTSDRRIAEQAQDQQAATAKKRQQFHAAHVERARRARPPPPPVELAAPAPKRRRAAASAAAASGQPITRTSVPRGKLPQKDWAPLRPPGHHV
jgi:hypothetical protein